ncbi:oxalurate catabolism protein HpxZ [Sphingomonas sp. BIUV-7]|uniref:Oxalurate catabolism protein HpxZ n=1 Tax=Sphingomonas natans TaxID=3063330 RepID=A0ABT8Y6L8_9SPHN|nr:oxalurate catabolism protein HpxZ [Sphingomonas sp. BIUV-7]MDO6413957.1 oxalurate catabolism protein HpxZ [Sphingomonas sp. BIUV-7]
MIFNDPETVAAVRAAFDAYEAALMADDVAAMDALFHPADTTVRYGVGEVLYGIDEIREFRKGRGGSPQRVLERVEIATFDTDLAIANAEFRREGDPRRGRQSQTWVRFADGWKVVSAHVSIEGSTS